MALQRAAWASTPQGLGWGQGAAPGCLLEGEAQGEAVAGTRPLSLGVQPQAGSPSSSPVAPEE